MKLPVWVRGASFTLLACVSELSGCSPGPEGSGAAVGGNPGAGGQAGPISGGAGSGGAAQRSGGASGNAGGGPSGGGTSAVGGSQSGLVGGAFAGGAPGGAPSLGGTSNGGAAVSGGAASGGASTVDFPFFLGADISSVQESNTTFVDTDGQTKTVFALLKNHGFNFIRLKTFVDPLAPYGYASKENGCPGKPEAFGDKAHLIAYGQQVKAEHMGLLVDFHYSDVWADPGNQIIPEAWRGAKTIEELAAFVKAYTKDFLESAIAGGARPDMVQIGNEITPGVMAHVPGPDTDCYGNNPASAPLGGSTKNWKNLGTLLKAGADAAREVDPNILVMLHTENTDDVNGVKSWVDNAVAQGVDFDVFGLSCYTKYQGQPSVWKNTFTTLAAAHPDLKFVIAEYNPERTAANQLMKELSGGLGTFFWEPTQGGDWGDAMFTRQGNTLTANAADFAEFDAMRASLGL